MGKASSDLIRVNCGGRTFLTKEATLKDGSAYFATLLSEMWNATEQQTQEPPEVFLDQDADAFAVVLSYMRSRSSELPPERALAARVVRLARYLQVNGLLSEILRTRQLVEMLPRLRRNIRRLDDMIEAADREGGCDSESEDDSAEVTLAEILRQEENRRQSRLQPLQAKRTHKEAKIKRAEMLLQRYSESQARCMRRARARVRRRCSLAAIARE